MSRGVRDLRDLICVSRLTFRASDDEEEVILSDEDQMKVNFDKLSLSTSDASGQDNVRIVSPDSGCGTNGSTPPDLPLEDSSSVIPATIPLQLPKNPQKVKKEKKSRRREKNKVLATEPTRHELPKRFVIPPVQRSVSSSNDEYEGDVVSKPEKRRFDRGPKRMHPSVKVQPTQAEGNFDEILGFMDATIVSGWLTRANKSLSELTAFCNGGDNFVLFAQFWLSDFDDLQKNEMYEMEHSILMEELRFAFAVGRDQRKVSERDLLNLVRALFREYPGKMLSAKGAYLFLNHLDTLTSQRQSEYRNLLSDVKASTKNKQYAQWLLATRSFILVGVWSAIVNFYRNLLGRIGITKPVTPAQLDEGSVYVHRLNQAIRLGLVQVVQYLLVAKFVKSDFIDSHGRTLIFSAVMHSRCEVLHYLIHRVKPKIDVNQAADTGNTPLHAAANMGSDKLVAELLQCPDINVNCVNPQCDNATPLHLAVMHGHRYVVELLMKAGADIKLKMGNLTPEDVAKEFGSLSIIPVLASTG